MSPDRFTPHGGEHFTRPAFKEALTPVPVRKVSLIVHPLFATGSKLDLDSERFLRALQRRFVPLAADEVTGVMYPHRTVDRECQEGLVLPFLQATTRFPNGVIEVPDMVLGTATLDDFFDTMKGSGFLITPQTSVIIGGEWVRNCVLFAARRISQDSRVADLRLDKRGVRATPGAVLEEHIEMFKDSFDRDSLREDEEYIYIKSPKPS